MGLNRVVAARTPWLRGDSNAWHGHIQAEDDDQEIEPSAEDVAAAAGTPRAGSVSPLQLPAPPQGSFVADRGRPGARWLGAAASALAVVAVSGGIVAVAGHGARPAHRTRIDGMVAFPGGGRILLSDAEGQEWLGADGKTAAVGAGFTGVSLADHGRSLLAWRPTRNPDAIPPCAGCSAGVNYYALTLNGTGRRLVLRAEPTTKRGNQVTHLDVQVSPGGSTLGYIRRVDRPSGSALSSQLWTLNLATGARADLGPLPSGALFAWQDSSTIVAQSRDLRSLVSINVRTGGRSQLISLSSPALVRAFERARPGAGRPTSITPLGASQAAARPVLAVDLTAPARNGTAINDAIALLTGASVTAYAAGGPRAYQSLTWGPDGYFAILTTTSPSGCPPLNGAAYVGNSRARHLARVPITSKNLIVGGGPVGAAFSPSGRYLAVDYQGLVTFTLTPTIASLTAGTGYPAHLRATTSDYGKALQGWARR